MNINIIEVISKYLNNSKYKLISKNFKKCIEIRQKKSVQIIESWYLKYPTIKTLKYLEFRYKRDTVRLYNYEYPTKYLLRYPESVTVKCGLSNKLLIGLNQDISNRKRSDIIKWLQKKEITGDVISGAGW